MTGKPSPSEAADTDSIQPACMQPGDAFTLRTLG